VRVYKAYKQQNRSRQDDQCVYQFSIMSTVPKFIARNCFSLWTCFKGWWWFG